MIKSRHQTSNLQIPLTKAWYVSKEKKKLVKKCNDSKCNTCNIFIEGKCIDLKMKKNLKPNSCMKCISKNLIYCAICPDCEEFYIVETGKLFNCVRIYKQQIKDPIV